MSDDDECYECDYGSDQEDGDFGSDAGAEGGGVNDELIEIENAFYEGDDLKDDDPKKAIELFEKVVDLETKRGETVKWRFKALQHLVTIHFALGNYEQMADRYRGMLDFMAAVTRNECTDAINAILDTLTAATDARVLSEMYEITLLALKGSNNERLWFNTNHKLAKLYLDGNKIPEVERLIAVLKQSCQRPDGSDDTTKGTYLLEVYCLEIQVCSKTRNSARMRQIYPRTMNLNAAVSDPRIMGIIREEGGKMHMSEGTSVAPLCATRPCPHHLIFGCVLRLYLRRRWIRELGRGVQRALRGVPELPRSRQRTRQRLPQVRGARVHAGTQRHQPVRGAGSEGVCGGQGDSGHG